MQLEYCAVAMERVRHMKRNSAIFMSQSKIKYRLINFQEYLHQKALGIVSSSCFDKKKNYNKTLF